MIVENSVAAATAVLEYDLMPVKYRQSSRPRLVKTFALTGSGAAGDTIVEMSKGKIPLGSKYNSATGFPTRDHTFPINEHIPANDEISLIVKDAPVTNPINLSMEIVEL